MAPPITIMLSQHAILRGLAEYLAGADIAHLAATSKENYTYITSSQTIYQELLSGAICSGKGSIARMAVFGESPMMFGMAGLGCLGYFDVQPCSVCRVAVCDECRFHLDYEDPESESIAELQGRNFIIEMFTGPHVSVSLEKAKEMYGWAKARMQRFCSGCHPLVLEEGSADGAHVCTLYEHFVGKRWLCIPCFLEEEAKMSALPIYRTTRCLHRGVPGQSRPECERGSGVFEALMWPALML